MQITHAFPCRNTKADRENASQVEAEISKAIDREKLTLVGWYHSHPFSAAAPTLRDIDAQLDYQIRMKGTSDSSYTPCIGIIICKYRFIFIFIAFFLFLLYIIVVILFLITYFDLIQSRFHLVNCFQLSLSNAVWFSSPPDLLYLL